MTILPVSYSPPTSAGDRVSDNPSLTAQHIRRDNHPVSESKSLFARAVEISRRINMSGVLRAYLHHDITTSASIFPKDIDPQTTLVTVNNRLCGIPMAGYSRDDNRDNRASHLLTAQILAFFPVSSSPLTGSGDRACGNPSSTAQHIRQDSQPVSESKSLLAQVMEICRRINVGGVLGAYMNNVITTPASISAEDIDPQTTIVTVNNRHSGILMGGYSQHDDYYDKASHVLIWSVMPNIKKMCDGLKAYGPSALTAQILTFIAVYYLPPLGLLDHITPLATTAGIFGLLEMTPMKPITAIIRLADREGCSPGMIRRSTFHPVALNGLDVKAMIAKANEIKQAGHYNRFTKNCASAVVAVIKAGLPEQVLAQLPPDPYIITPSSVSQLVRFLVANDYVQSGDVDDEGVAWFDALPPQPDQSVIVP